MRLRGDNLRVQLFKALHAVMDVLEGTGCRDSEETAYERRLESNLARLEPRDRKILILAVVERFSHEDVALILGIERTSVRRGIARARLELQRQTAIPVLIIEDEALIAMSIETAMMEMGLKVTGSVPSEEEAIATAHDDQPQLVLSDIQLADEGSGLAAAQSILERFEVPIVFVTGYPERLLTGGRTEPAFVVSKPFNPESLKVTVAQALATYSTDSRASEHRGELLTKLRRLNSGADLGSWAR